jgi:hypothetical protein
MAKTSGLGSAVVLDNSAGTPQTISNDITNWECSTPRAVQEVTGVDKYAIERLLLLADYSVTLNGVFNPAASSDVTSDGSLRTLKIQPTAETIPSLSVETLFTDYQVTRADSGELTFQAPGVLADGTIPSWTNS